MSEKDARLDPDALASFKALRLNMGVSDVDRAVLLDAEAWVRAEGLPRRDGSGEFVVGIDLGGNAAMNAAGSILEDGAA